MRVQLASIVCEMSYTLELRNVGIGCSHSVPARSIARWGYLSMTRPESGYHGIGIGAVGNQTRDFFSYFLMRDGFTPPRSWNGLVYYFVYGYLGQQFELFETKGQMAEMAVKV